MQFLHYCLDDLYLHQPEFLSNQCNFGDFGDFNLAVNKIKLLGNLYLSQLIHIPKNINKYPTSFFFSILAKHSS